MGTITTSQNPRATGVGSQRKIDRTQNGVLWSLTQVYGSTPLALAYSTDGGTTWSSGGAIANGGGGSTGGDNTNASFFIDLDDFAHLVQKDGDNGYIYYRRGTPNAARTAYTWSAATAITSSAAFDVPDIVVCRDPATAGAWVGYVVLSFVGNQTSKVFGYRINIAANGAVTVGSQDNVSANSLATANSNLAYASIDFNHTGDGKTVAGGTPHWCVGWSAGATGSGYGIRFRKATYSAGSWTWGTEREIDNTHLLLAGGNQWMTTHFDGVRVVLAGGLSNAAQSDIDIVIHDRDASDPASGGTTTRTVLTATLGGANALLAGSASYDASGNVYLFGADVTGASGTRKVNSRRWVRATQALDAVSTFDASGSNQPYVSARRGYQGQAIDYVYTDGTASPFTVTSGRITLNQNPTAPTPVSPADNATWDSSTDQAVVATYSDPDGNPASKARLYYRPKGTSAVFAVIEQNTTAASGSNISTTVPAGTWPGPVEYYTQFADSSGAWSDPSPTRTVTGIPTALAALTGGGGGTAFSAWTISNATENARIQRATTRALTTTVTSVSPLTITVDGGPVTAMRNAGYTPTAGDTVQAEYVSGAWIVQDKIVS